MVVLQLHFLYLSNGNFVSQKEQIKLVGAELPGGVGEGVDLDASSSVETFSCSGCSWESFIVVTGLLTFLFKKVLRVDPFFGFVTPGFNKK